MNPRPRTLRLSAAAVATFWIATCVGGPALAADPGVDVVNTETVQVYLDASGKVDSKRVYEQIDLTGHGNVDLRNPIETKGLRNLDGFSGIDVVDGKQVVKTSVDGSRRLRSVSDFTGRLPLDVRITYKLNGKTVKPGQVVGKAGKLQVRFDVTNVTSQSQDVTYSDGKGGTVTKTVEVPVPIVGSLTTVAPSNFTNVSSGEANVAGDGEGGTKLSFTMTLFPPIGAASTSFGYTADIKDGVVPRVEISALPVNPLESPTFKSAAQSYQGGADTGSQLTSGASEIDANLLKLRDGAADLLAGLIKLNDGADQLSTGLNGTAVPGARKLATGADQLADGLVKIDDGASELADGTGQLDDGAKKLKKGAKQLATGAGDAADGSKKLTAGLKQIDGGLDQLADSKTGLPTAQDGVKQLQDGVKALLAGLGDVDDDKTLIGGLHKLNAGLSSAKGGAARLEGGLLQLKGDGSAGNPGLVGAKGGVDQVQSGLHDAVKPGGSTDQLIGGLGLVKATAGCSSDPVCVGTVNSLISGAQTSKQNLTDADNGLQQVSGGLATALGGLGTVSQGTTLIGGAHALNVGLGDAVTGGADLESGATDARTGVRKISAGLDQLAVGVTKAVSGVLQLSAGAGDAYNGSTTLSSGLKRLDAGAGDLSNGAGDLADGTGQLRTGADKLSAGAGDASDGAGQVSKGAGDLADGLGDAATGSQQLADGLSKAADGAPQLVDGSERLSTEGTKKLVAAGESTAQSYGEMVAVINAGARRAQTQDMAYGAPSDARGLTAYSYVIEGDDGEGGRNLARGIGAVAVLGAGAGILALRRRFI